MNWWKASVIILTLLTSCTDDTLFVENYPNGQIKEQRRYAPKEDRGSGNYTFQQYAETGELLAEGQMVAGQKHGKRTEYFLSGRLKSTGNYRSGTKFGLFEEYHDNGQLHSRENFSYAGMPDGNTEVYDRLGRILMMGKYFSGVPVDTWQYLTHGEDWKKEYIQYDPDGIIRHKKVFLNRQDPNYCEFTALNREGNVDSTGAYRLGLRVGEWKYYYSFGGKIKSEGSFSEGKEHGTWVYWLNGAIQSQGLYEHGVKTGMWEMYGSYGHTKWEDRYENGEKFLENYWYDQKQTVRNGRGYVDKIDYEYDDKYEYTIRIRTWIRKGIEKGSTRTVLNKNLLDKPD